MVIAAFIATGVKMDRFSILKGISPPPTLESLFPPLNLFNIEGIQVAIMTTEHFEKLEELKYPLNEFLIHSHKRPSFALSCYCVFVSNSLTEEILKSLFLDSKQESMFSFYKKHTLIRSDHIWTQSQRCRLDSLGLNFLKYIPGQGFFVWSDNIIGSIWDGLEIQYLSTHRLLSYIANLEGDLYHKYITAKGMNLEVEGNPFISFTLKIPGEPHCITLSERIT